jgi:AP2-like factor, ANT lineage
MSPPTNGAISLAYAPSMMLGAGALTNPPLLPFDGFTDEDFLASADAALLGGADTDQTLLLLPSCPGANCCGGSSSDQGLGALACEVTTAGSFSLLGQPAPGQVSWEVTTAVAADRNTFSRARDPAPSPPPSPALPLVQTTSQSQRTSIYRGVTRYQHACA